MTFVGRAEVTINIPLRGGYLGFGPTIMSDSPVDNRGSLSAKER
jgi:hypothetical protein